MATVAAVALTDPGHRNLEYDITGPEPVSYADVAAVIAEFEGREVNYVDVSNDDARNAMLAAGMDSRSVGALVEL